MTTITLPPDLEGRISDEARRLGTTSESLALESLRKVFAPPPTKAVLPEWCNVYEGLTDDEIAEIEETILTRADLSRSFE